VLMGADLLETGLVADTLNVLLKYEQDVQKVREKLPGLIPDGGSGENFVTNDGGNWVTGDNAGDTGDKPAEKKSDPVKTRLEEILERFDF
ncbi:MAG: hypothetical protein K6U74_15730, partial [Firmicutes bacterium]|nr:hypothetical protein [Bacillota bacterium]